MSEVLGKITFSETPDVNGTNVLLNAGGIESISSGLLANRPAAAIVGRLYLATDENLFYRDNGSSWDDLSTPAQVTGTANQITTTLATTSSPAVISLPSDIVMPGIGSFRPPSGTAAERPATPTQGDTRYNSTTKRLETFNGTYWIADTSTLQVVSANINAATGTTTVPYDNTKPTNTEGWQYFSVNFTPISATSRLIISFNINAAMTSAGQIISSVFAGTVNLGSMATVRPASGLPTQMAHYIVYSPASTATITFTGRIGGSAASTTYVNQGSAATLGGAMITQITIEEKE